MQRGTQSILGLLCLFVIISIDRPGHAQIRGPRIRSVSHVTCVANWERRFRLISPGMWEMRLLDNSLDPFLFRETKRTRTSITLQALRNQRLKATLNLNRQRIKYVIPSQEDDPFFFNIQTFNINGGSC